MRSKSYFITVKREMLCKIVAQNMRKYRIRYKIESKIYEQKRKKKENSRGTTRTNFRRLQEQSNDFHKNYFHRI